MRHRVLIADDHRLMLEAVRIAFEGLPDFEIVGMVSSGEKVLPMVASLRPDVVLLDVRMPGMDGLACLDLLKERHPKVTVIVLSGIDDPSVVQSACRRGAAAFILKHIDPRDLASAVRQAIEGTVCQTFGKPAFAVAAVDDVELTERERSVLESIAAGHSNKEIAQQLFLSEQTIKFHLTGLYAKLGVRGRTEAARAAYQRGMLEPPLLEGVG